MSFDRKTENVNVILEKQSPGSKNGVGVKIQILTISYLSLGVLNTGKLKPPENFEI